MKILIAVDGSPPALRAVEYVSDHFGPSSPGSHGVTLICVHDDAGLRHAEHFVGDEAVRDYLRDSAEENLRAARELLDAAHIAYAVEIRIGHLAGEIVAFAATGSFDLIVLGSKGRSGLADLLLGSVAQRVLTTATQPVLLVK